jgi:putative sterol carrier protein
MELAELKKAIHDKIEEGALRPEDIPDYLRVLCAIGNASADIQEEVDGWDCRLQLVLAGSGEHWVTVAGGRFEVGSGRLAESDVSLGMSAAVAAEIFAGERDAKAAFLAGALKIEGALPSAVKFQSIVEIVVEELEYTATS